ncbi:MAG: hypothetical protein JST83_00945 [Bacteroidetes bacterium]|nr:hypothetical protein [Bacteroidota bacterium]
METNFAALICFLPLVITVIKALARYEANKEILLDTQSPAIISEARPLTEEEKEMIPDYMPEPREPFPLLLMRLGIEMVIMTENENEE